MQKSCGLLSRPLFRCHLQRSRRSRRSCPHLAVFWAATKNSKIHQAFPLMFFFPLTMEAGFRASAVVTLYCRRAISRSDLRCSPPSAPPALPLCSFVSQGEPIPPHPRDDCLKARGLPPRPVQACLLLQLLHLHPPLLPFLSFVCQTYGLYQWDGSDVHRSIWKIKLVGAGVHSGRPGDTDMNALFTRTFTHPQCFLWPKQLVFVVKRLIRKRSPLCRRSWAFTRGQQPLNSDKSACFRCKRYSRYQRFTKKLLAAPNLLNSQIVFH